MPGRVLRAEPHIAPATAYVLCLHTVPNESTASADEVLGHETDCLDVQLSVLTAERVQPDPHPLRDADLYDFEALITPRRQLVDMITAEWSRLESSMRRC